MHDINVTPFIDVMLVLLIIFITQRLPVGGSVLVLPAGHDVAAFMTDPVEHGDLSSDHVAGAGPLWLTAAVLERSNLVLPRNELDDVPDLTVPKSEG